MLRTYKAVLRGDRVEWIDAGPTASRPTPVHITLLEDETAGSASRGLEMAAALEALARRGGISAIPDAAAWQREERRDRDFPGRAD